MIGDNIVQLTITSEDSLDRVMSAVGAMFGITLTVATGETSPAAGEQSVHRSRGTTSRRRASSRRRRPVGQGPSSADIRRWAQDNGYDVSPRGRIPAKVAAAYREAH